MYGSRGHRTFNSENVISLDGKGVTVGHLFDKTELEYFMIQGIKELHVERIS